VCIFCPEPGAPSNPDIPDGCVLVDLFCDGAPFEVWCGDVAGSDSGDDPQYTPTLLRFLDAVGPTLEDDGAVELRYTVDQAEDWPPIPLRGNIALVRPNGTSIVYEPGVTIPAGTEVRLSGLASDLAYNLYYLGIDSLAFTDNVGRWELRTLRRLGVESDDPPFDLPYVFLTLNGQFYGQPYDISAN